MSIPRPMPHLRRGFSRVAILLGVMLIGACAGTSPLPAPAPLQEKIAAVLAAYGGREALANVTAVYAQGHIDDFLRGTSGGYARTMRRPGGLRIDIMPERGGEVRILDGERGWQGSGDTLREANPFSLQSMRYQYGYLDLPMSLADGSAQVSDGGQRQLDGQLLDVLLIDLAAAPQLRAYIDPATHLIRRVEADFSMGGMGTSQLGTEYEAFRPIDGLLFPHRLNNFAGGGRISVIVIDRLTINQPLPAGVFSPN